MASYPKISSNKIILLVEDNPADARLITEFLKDTDLKFALHSVTDGLEAIEFLNRQCKIEEKYCPNLIILDLNLPKMNGSDVLKLIKEDNDLKNIPVLILTTSTAEEDINVCYESHASCYITKPVDFTDFERVMNIIKDFWLGAAELPP